MNKINLIKKFRPQRNFQFLNHIIKTIRILFIYGFLLLPINCILNLSFHFRIRNILTYQFWSSDEVINANITVPIAILINLFYIIFYEEQKAETIKDYICTMTITHISLVLIITHELRFKLVIYLLIISIILILIGEFVALKKQQNSMINIISKLEKMPFIKPNSQKQRNNINHSNNDERMGLIETHLAKQQESFVNIELLN